MLQGVGTKIGEENDGRKNQSRTRKPRLPLGTVLATQVEWESQARGEWKEKRGQVLAFVPANTDLLDHIPHRCVMMVMRRTGEVLFAASLVFQVHPLMGRPEPSGFFRSPRSFDRHANPPQECSAIPAANRASACRAAPLLSDTTAGPKGWIAAARPTPKK